MTTRLLTALFAMLLALGAVACDNTVDGVQEDAEELQQDIEDELDDGG